MVRFVNEKQVETLLDMGELLDVVENAILREATDEVERPRQASFPAGIDIGKNPEPLGTMLVMPAYIHGSQYSVTKIVNVQNDECTRTRDTVTSDILLTDVETGVMSAQMGGTTITNARTGCLGGLAAQRLADEPVSLGVFGAGPQARAQVRALDCAVDLADVSVFTPSDSRFSFADRLNEAVSPPVTAAESPAETVSDANVVVTATTATEPVFDGADLQPGTLVVAVGAYTPEMQELDETTMDRAARVYGDLPEEIAETGDVLNTGLDPERIEPFSSVIEQPPSTADGDITVVESVGMATLDAAAAEYIYTKAKDQWVGTQIEV